ncbi:AGE family epimerase/isomerase [Acetobacter persici]|uniref:AGE family epimerase/isomerase n=1 Tax=Acetobacter persici TaxID=1076596 RepID=UPI001BAABFF2|nr:AGE family epimerase/isomerase [Acetobacter persici]MBS1017179.1 AGE family epimerase/isomerase [Acetobacter persici]
MSRTLPPNPLTDAQTDGAPLPLVAVRDRFSDWLFQKALPFWATTGCDGTPHELALLGAQEHLTLEGEPALPPFKRVRVQARQLFAFSWAALQGWEEGVSRAHGIFRFMLHAHREDGGWARTLTREGAVKDATADLYDIAFVVFALAWYGRLEGSGRAEKLARDTLGWVQQHMATPNGGFLNWLPDDGAPRQQNPHMHLLEAALALYGTTHHEADLALAHTLYELFRTRFQDPVTGTLGEFFTKDWQPVPGEAGQWVEPGHHFEWVWLLGEYQRLTGVETSEPALRLASFATRFGLEPETGRVRDVLARDGSVLRGGSRLWVQGEALRGILSRDRLDSRGIAVRLAENLLDHYFTGCPVGTWVDQLDAAGAPAVTKIPTSSLYHIITAFDALDLAAKQATKPVLPKL